MLMSTPENRERFPDYPFGHDFTDDELVLSRALTWLKAETATPLAKLATLLRSVRTMRHARNHQCLLARMSLQAPDSPGARLQQWLVVYALERTLTPHMK